MKIRFALLAVPFLSLPLSPLAAQRPEALEPGRRSLSFALPQGGGGSFGIWTMRSERTNLGLIGSLSLDLHETVDQSREVSRTAWGVSLAPTLRRYVAGAGERVAPFLSANLGVGYGQEDADIPGRAAPRSWHAGVGGGFGVEWFPAEQVSIGGNTGLTLSYGETDMGIPHSRGFNVRTGTSSLTLQIYF